MARTFLCMPSGIVNVRWRKELLLDQVRAWKCLSYVVISAFPSQPLAIPKGHPFSTKFCLPRIGCFGVPCLSLNITNTLIAIHYLNYSEYPLASK